MQWIAPPAKDTATDALEKRLWDSAGFRGRCRRRLFDTGEPNTFCNSTMSLIAVTVAMIATRTDIKPLEVFNPPSGCSQSLSISPQHKSQTAAGRMI